MFEKVLVKSPKRAKFDFSHGNTLSMQFGKLTPTELRFIVPGDDVSVSMEQIVRVAPMPVPTFVNMKIRHDWFFVPLSMMYDQLAMDQLLSQNASSTYRARFQTLAAYIKKCTDYDPSSYGSTSQGMEPFLPGSIHDYFNLPVFTDINTKQNPTTPNSNWTTFVTTPTAANYANLIGDATISAATGSLPGPILEPFLAYHYIWRDWYRFTGYADSVTPGDNWLENHIFTPGVLANPFSFNTALSDSVLGIGSSQYHSSAVIPNYFGRAYYAYLKKDPFTSSRYGTKPAVLIPTGASGTIPNLRTASAVQKFIDIVTVSGQRYWDKIKALFDETPSGMKCERAQFIARYMSFIKVGEVITTATTTQANTGDYAGRGMLVDGKYLFKRHFNEHGWLMCISSIVPEMAYCGYDRQLTDSNMLDTPIPNFANVGDQSILHREIRVMYDGSLSSINNTSFGDQFRYYAYKSDVNRIHGDFLMSSFSPWTALQDYNSLAYGNAESMGRVSPLFWNKLFDVTTTTSPFFNGRFFVDLTFHEFITRKLPKYVSYSL